jgi:hypothetical protein
MYDVLRPLDIELSSRKLSRLSPGSCIGSHGLFHTVDDSLVCVIGIDSSKIDRNVSLRMRTSGLRVPSANIGSRVGSNDSKIS